MLCYISLLAVASLNIYKQDFITCTQKYLSAPVAFIFFSSCGVPAPFPAFISFSCGELYLLSALFSPAACALCASKQILIAHYQPFVGITFFPAGTRYHPQKSRTFWGQATMLEFFRWNNINSIVRAEPYPIKCQPDKNHLWYWEPYCADDNELFIIKTVVRQLRPQLSHCCAVNLISDATITTEIQMAITGIILLPD